MLWITLLLALLIALAALGYVIWPLISREVPLLPVEDSRLTDLLARKDAALRAIKDLEFDHQVGKIADEDYQRLRERLNRQAIVLLQQLERFAPESATLDAQLEAEIAALRQVQATNRAESSSVGSTAVNTAALSPSSPAPADGADPAASAAVAAGTVRFCTECGVRIDPSFKFCANCGSPIARPDMQTAT
ncbi:MAG TPA: zinc-ribbon domain-containing protein [Caldilineaceae bacterium]|nr:zinc-ribbon domain-containing protein [Caldilineaceae bacterium]